MRTYQGYGNFERGWIVTVENDLGEKVHLNPRLDLRQHSPTGFAWGYQGSGPAQLSLALLANALEDDSQALELYQPFKQAVISQIPSGESWTMTDSIIKAICRSLRRMG